MVKLLISVTLLTNILNLSADEVETYLNNIRTSSPRLNLKIAAHTENNRLMLEEIRQRTKNIFTKTISELKVFLNTPLFYEMSDLFCQTSKYMNHLIFEPPFNGSQWVKVLNHGDKLAPHQRFKQELCFIKENLDRFDSSLLVIEEDDDNCQPGPEKQLNLEYVFGRGNKLLWKIYLCPQALRKISRQALDQALRYISLHEVFHLIGLEHFIDRPTDLMPQKLWLLNSLLYRPVKVAKTRIGRRLNKVENYRYSHIEHIGSVVSDPIISFKEISPFLKDQNIINAIEAGQWEKRIKNYFEKSI